MANNTDDIKLEETDGTMNNLSSKTADMLTDPLTTEAISFSSIDKTETQGGVKGENFERYKMKVELLKWLIGTVGITLITLIINWGFKDRQQGMNEISQYDKYATELIVLNDNPVKKRMLAQFFANVTPSEKLKDGWNNYYKEVNIEYEKFLQEANNDKKQLDSLRRLDSYNMTQSQMAKLNEAENKVKENESKINAPLLVPELNSNLEGNIKSIVSNRFVKTDNKNVELAKELEDKGFSYLIQGDMEMAINSFTQSENAYNGYHMVYDIARYLKANKDKLELNNPESRKLVYATILSKYSWNMPEIYRSKLTELSK